MGQRPKDLTPHESLHHYWGAELRALRIARGLSLAELGQQLHCDSSYLAKIERAERPIPATLAESCDQVFEANGALIRLHALAESGRDLAAKRRERPSTDVAGDEDHVASQTGNLDEEIVVPARTADGRVVFVSVPRRVFLQGLGSAAIGLTAMPLPLPAAAPLSTAGDVHPVEHFQQMLRVLIDNDKLFGARQVIPVVREQIAIMQQLRSSWRGADQHALIGVQARYTEFCGWLHKDMSEHQLAEFWMDRALGLSHLSADHELTAYILASKAELAGDMRVPADAISAGEQAMRMTPSRSRIGALAATRAARGYALDGNSPAMERTYDRARELLDSTDDDPDFPGASWLNENTIALSQAQSRTFVGDYHRAALGFQRGIAELPSSYRRGRGVYLARAALAHAGDHEVEQAATLGRDALTIGADTRSGRILTDLIRLDDALARWRTTPAVADFHSAMRDTISRQT
jgi:transcriptional regulator with XRE-family HTH domain